MASSFAPFRDREFVALAGTAFARSQAYSTVLIALALYADVFTTTGTIEGLFGTAFAVVQVLIALPLGRKVDTGNARRWLLAGLLLNVVVLVGFTLVENPVHVILMRILQGTSASVLWITGSSVVGDISPDRESGRWLGAFSQVSAFSSMIGDLLGGYLLFSYGFTAAYAVVSAVTVAVFVAVLLYVRDDPGGRTDPRQATGRETLRSLLDRDVVRSLVFFRMAFSVGKVAVVIFLPIFAHREFGISAFAIGWILAGGKLTKSLLQGYMGDLTDRWEQRHRFVIAGALLFALGTTLLPFARVAQGMMTPIQVQAFGVQSLGGAFFTLFAAYSVLGVADSMRIPASMALFVEEGQRFNSVASSMSLRTMAWKLGEVTGPALVGLVKDTISMPVGFFVAAGMVTLAALVFAVTHSPEEGEGEARPAASDAAASAGPDEHEDPVISDD